MNKDSTGFRFTRYSCYLCFIVQAIVINFPPVLFLTFSNKYGIPLTEITLLAIMNFACQFVMDSLAALFASKINYRAMAIVANLFAAVGLISMAILPEALPSPYIGLLISVLLSAVGGGLIEVIANPIMQSCPKEGKGSSMGLLHSFYCWGHLGVVIISTLFISFIGGDTWITLAFVWAAVPAITAISFFFVPINQPCEEDERNSSPKMLFKTRIFWLFAIIMMLGGACEQGMAQWGSAFAELAFIDYGFASETAKLLGDLMGPCTFALTMATARLLQAKFSYKFNLKYLMAASAGLCTVCYIISGLSSSPLLSLVGCGICGLSVGIMWPGTLDFAAASCPYVGTALFAMLSLAGDIGCTLGPSLVGIAADTIGGGMLKVGLLIGALLPFALLITLLLFRSSSKHSSTQSNVE